MSLQLLRNRAVMYVPAAANTYYPTGVNVGLTNRVGTVFAAGATRSTTATQSVFLKEKPAADFNMQFVIRHVQMNQAAAAGASTTDIQAHATTDMLVPQFLATAGQFLTQYQPLEIGAIFHGGFKVVTAGGASGLMMIVYEYELG